MTLSLETKKDANYSRRAAATRSNKSFIDRNHLSSHTANETPLCFFLLSFFGFKRFPSWSLVAEWKKAGFSRKKIKSAMFLSIGAGFTPDCWPETNPKKFKKEQSVKARGEGIHYQAISQKIKWSTSKKTSI